MRNFFLQFIFTPLGEFKCKGHEGQKFKVVVEGRVFFYWIDYENSKKPIGKSFFAILNIFDARGHSRSKQVNLVLW